MTCTLPVWPVMLKIGIRVLGCVLLVEMGLCLIRRIKLVLVRKMSLFWRERSAFLVTGPIRFGMETSACLALLLLITPTRHRHA